MEGLPQTAVATAWSTDARQATIPALVLAHHPDRAHLGLVVPLLDPLVLGRGSAELGAGVLDDRRLSREHVRLEPADGGLRLTDLGSTNGTFVDGVRVEAAEPGPGAVIRIGDLVFVRRDLPPDHRTPRHPRLLGVGPAVARVLRSLRTVGPESMAVLIRGETGVGKELVARELHATSGRTGEFVAVHCAGIDDGTLTSQLFGHRRGAFTGATRDEPGLVVQADGGTLFLDEIGDASPRFQAALLRVLQERVVRPVGGRSERPVDLRVVAATHVELDRAVAEGGFRADLLARLDRWTFELPPLRDRIEDVPTLVAAVVDAPEASLVHRLMLHPWPGNIRELQSVARWFALRRQAGEGAHEELERRLDSSLIRGGLGVEERPPEVSVSGRPPREELVAVFHEHRGRMTGVAAALGVSRATVYRWFEAEGIDPAKLRR